MSIDPILPILAVQDMGPTAKLAHDVAVRPEMAQAMAKDMAEAMLREQSKQVQRLEDPDLTSSVSTDEDGRNRQEQQAQGERRRQEEDDDPPQPQLNDPFVGKLVNKKI